VLVAIAELLVKVTFIAGLTRLASIIIFLLGLFLLHKLLEQAFVLHFLAQILDAFFDNLILHVFLALLRFLLYGLHAQS